MKNTLLATLLCLAAGWLHAQKIVEKHAAVKAGAKVILNIQIADSIKIITWNKNEAYIKASVNVNDNKNNDDYTWNFDDADGDFTVKAKFADKKSIGNKNCNCGNYDAKIYCEVYVPENANISVETINGDIVITGNTGDVKAHSISGFVDFSVPAADKADVKLSTISGTLYTNVDLGVDKGSAKRVGGNTVNASLNGGGKVIDLATISGDIFLRKAGM